MNRFASGPKRHYYGKGDVIVYRLRRDGTAPPGLSPVFGANVLMLLYGDAFWKTYTDGDNTGLVATDSIKNFIQRETMRFEGHDLESYCRFLARTFLERYAHVEGVQISASQIPYAANPQGIAFAPVGPDRPTARLETNRAGLVDVCSGIAGFRLLRLGGSAFTGFVRDEYTTLPELRDRPLHMWLDLEWRYERPDAAFTNGSITSQVRAIVLEVFASRESCSIQHLIYQMATSLLERIPAITEVHFEAQNRTWDTIAEDGDTTGVYADPRPPYGCLGLTLSRDD